MNKTSKQVRELIVKIGTLGEANFHGQTMVCELFYDEQRLVLVYYCNSHWEVRIESRTQPKNPDKYRGLVPVKTYVLKEFNSWWFKGNHTHNTVCHYFEFE